MAEKPEIHKCKACKVTLPDINAYVEHLESKEHVKGLMKSKYGEKYLEAKAKLNGNVLDVKPKETKTKLDMAADNSQNSDEDDVDVYTCELCKKVCTGHVNYRLHLEGKKHQKNIKKEAMMKQMTAKNLVPESEPTKGDSLLDQFLPRSHTSEVMECKFCNIKCSGPENYRQHCRSENHHKRLVLIQKRAELKSKGLAIPDEDDEDGQQWHCDVCEKGFSGLVPYIQHMESLAHLRQARFKEDIGKFKDLYVSPPDDNKLHCTECGKSFSGPEPFKHHLKTGIHRKLKMRTDIMDKLTKNHPEFINSKNDKSDDDCDEENGILGCEICHTVFSGPEAARDHFVSAKHRKTKRKQAEFQKFKQQKEKQLMESGGSNAETGGGKPSGSDDEFDIIPNI